MAFTPKLKYKGRPLVRCKNEIYYGNFSDPFVIYMQVLTTKEDHGVQTASTSFCFPPTRARIPLSACSSSR